MNWTTFMKTEKERIRVCPHSPKPNLICQKRESLFFFSCPFSFSLSIYLLIVDDLWLNRRLSSRTSCGKKMNGIDTISSREEPTSISCYEYESVHHLIEKKNPERNKKKIRKEWVLSLNLIYNWLIVYLRWLFFRQKQFLFWELLWLLMLFI